MKRLRGLKFLSEHLSDQCIPMHQAMLIGCVFSRQCGGQSIKFSNLHESKKDNDMEKTDLQIMKHIKKHNWK